MRNFGQIASARQQQRGRVSRATEVAIAAGLAEATHKYTHPGVYVHSMKGSDIIVTHGLAEGREAPCPRCRGKGRDETVNMYTIEYGPDEGKFAGFCLSCAKREKVWSLQPLSYFGYEAVE
jgi:hypothetical protein